MVSDEILQQNKTFSDQTQTEIEPLHFSFLISRFISLDPAECLLTSTYGPHTALLFRLMNFSVKCGIIYSAQPQQLSNQPE